MYRPLRLAQLCQPRPVSAVQYRTAIGYHAATFFGRDSPMTTSGAGATSIVRKKMKLRFHSMRPRSRSKSSGYFRAEWMPLVFDLAVGPMYPCGNAAFSASKRRSSMVNVRPQMTVQTDTIL
jgi:hypothetical protein